MRVATPTMRSARVNVLLAVFLVAGCLNAPPLDSSMGPAPAPMPTCLDPCDVDLGGPPGTKAEPIVAVDPSDPLHIVAGSMVFETLESGVTTSWLAAHVSRDGGRTWEAKRLPGGPQDPTHPLGAYNSMGDPVVTILADGTVIFVGLAFHGVNAVADAAGAFVFQDLSLFVARSQDGGLNYPDVRVVAQGIGGWAFVFGGPVFETLFSPSDLVDKPAIARGADGTLLLTWTQGLYPVPDRPAEASEENIRFSLSRDGGRSWSPPADVVRGHYHGSSPLIGPDGTLYVSFVALAAAETVPAYLATSHDSGRSWEMRHLTQVAGARHPSQALAIQDRGSAERLLFVFPAPPVEGLTGPGLVWSEDGGTTWSAPILLDPPEAPGNPLPSVALDGRGEPYVAFYHPLDAEGRMEFRVAAMRDDGPTPAVALNSQAFIPGFAQLHYAGVAGMPEGAFAVWVGGAAPDTQVRGALLI